MRIKARINNRNQVTLPKEVRDTLKLNTSDKTLIFDIKDNGTISIKKQNDNLWDIVTAQEKIYGKIATPEFDFGKDVGKERID